MKAKKMAARDRYGVLRVVDLGGAEEEHTHEWEDITDAPQKDLLVQKGSDGKISGEVLPESVVQKGENGKIAADILPENVVQKDENGKLPADSLPGMATGETPLVLGAQNGQAGKFDRITEAPTEETPLRYNGVLRATKLFGVYFSDNADLAERYPVEGPWEPGDLIQICSDGSLRRNEAAFNRSVLGFVSTKPGCVLGDKTEGPPIALAGRVPVKVVGPVWPGDYLEAADEPGCVQRVEPDHALRGAIVAQALEKKTTSGPGLVMALVLRM